MCGGGAHGCPVRGRSGVAWSDSGVLHGQVIGFSMGLVFVGGAAYVGVKTFVSVDLRDMGARYVGVD